MQLMPAPLTRLLLSFLPTCTIRLTSGASPPRHPSRPRSAAAQHPVSPSTRGPATTLLSSPGLVPRSVAAAAAAAAGRRIIPSPEPSSTAFTARAFASSPTPPAATASFVAPPPPAALLESLASQQQLLQRQVDAALAVQGADITNLAVAVGEVDDACRQAAGAVVEVGCAVEGLMQRVSALEEGGAVGAQQGAVAPAAAAVSAEQAAEAAKALRRLDRRVRALEQHGVASAEAGEGQAGEELARTVGECRAAVDELGGCMDEVVSRVAAQGASGESLGDSLSQLQMEMGRMCSVMESLVERVTVLEAAAAAAAAAAEGKAKQQVPAPAADEEAISARVAALLESRVEAMVAARVEAVLLQRREASANGTERAAVSTDLERRFCDLETASDELRSDAACASADAARTGAVLIELAARVDRLSARYADGERQTEGHMEDLSGKLHQLSCQVVTVNEGSAAVEDVEALKEAVEKVEVQLAKDRSAAEAAAKAAARSVLDDAAPRLRAEASVAAETAAEAIAGGAAARAARTALGDALAAQEERLAGAVRAAAEEAAKKVSDGQSEAQYEVVQGMEARLSMLERAHQVTVEEVTEHVAAAGEKLVALEAEVAAQVREYQSQLAKQTAHSAAQCAMLWIHVGVDWW